MRSNSICLTKGLEVVLAANMTEVGVFDGEVGCEHGGCDLATVGTIAHKSINEAGPISRLSDC